jgi:hypothetical protein
MVKNVLSFLCLVSMIVGAYFVLSDWDDAVGNVELIKPEKHLEASIPMDFDGLKGRDIPLGATEEVMRATEKILAVNEFLNREYTMPDGRRFSVYISYWAPKKEPVRVASTHTPDRCWVRNGWKNDDSKKKQHEVLNVAGKNLMPAYYREYTVENMEKIYRRYVWFWFVVDGKRYDYKTSDNYAPNPIMYVKNMVEDALQGSPEMYFVRIDSDIPLAELFKAREFKSALEKLGELILFEKKQPESGIKK